MFSGFTGREALRSRGTYTVIKLAHEVETDANVSIPFHCREVKTGGSLSGTSDIRTNDPARRSAQAGRGR